jgi:hypothetical protein
MAGIAALGQALDSLGKPLIPIVTPPAFWGKKHSSQDHLTPRIATWLKRCGRPIAQTMHLTCPTLLAPADEVVE